MTRRRSMLAPLAALAAMLFTQAALSFAACDFGPAHGKPMRTAQAQDDAPCHEPAESTSLCVAHCESADVSLDKPQVKLPAVASSAPAALPLARSFRPRLAARRVLTLPAGPPPRILFQSFLI